MYKISPTITTGLITNLFIYSNIYQNLIMHEHFFRLQVYNDEEQNKTIPKNSSPYGASNLMMNLRFLSILQNPVLFTWLLCFINYQRENITREYIFEKHDSVLFQNILVNIRTYETVALKSFMWENRNGYSVRPSLVWNLPL